MGTATNPITGDLIKTKGSNDSYRDGWERIFGNKKKESSAEVPAETKPEQKAEQKAELRDDTLRREWWAYCEEHQATFNSPNSDGNLVPSFEEWKKLAGK